MIHMVYPNENITGRYSKRYGTDLWDLTRVISSSRVRNVVDSRRHVDDDLISMHRYRWASALLEGQDDNCRVVCTEHAFFPKQQSGATQTAGARHSLWPLVRKKKEEEGKGKSVTS